MCLHNFTPFVLFQNQDKCTNNSPKDKADKLQNQVLKPHETIVPKAAHRIFTDVVINYSELPQFVLARRIIELIQLFGGAAGFCCSQTYSVTYAENQFSILVVSKHLGSACWPKEFPFNNNIEILANISGITTRILVQSGNTENPTHMEDYKSVVEQNGELFCVVRTLEDFIEWHNTNFYQL